MHINADTSKDLEDFSTIVFWKEKDKYPIIQGRLSNYKESYLLDFYNVIPYTDNGEESTEYKRRLKILTLKLLKEVREKIHEDFYFKKESLINEESKTIYRLEKVLGKYNIVKIKDEKANG